MGRGPVDYSSSYCSSGELQYEKFMEGKQKLKLKLNPTLSSTIEIPVFLLFSHHQSAWEVI